MVDLDEETMTRLKKFIQCNYNHLHGYKGIEDMYNTDDIFWTGIKMGERDAIYEICHNILGIEMEEPYNG